MSAVGVDLSERVLGNWQLVRRLGRGSFGTVYEARNRTIAGRRAAVKVLHPELALDAEIKRRFVNEASATSAAENENIVQVFDGGFDDDGHCYVVMELLEGSSLRAVFDRGPLDAERAVNLGLQIANALRAAHALGVVHRDLKPANVFICRRTFHAEFVKVLDFGIAKLMAPDGLATQTGSWIGTPQYMSPEQWQAKRDVDGRADVYALGVLLFEAMTGALPFAGETHYDWMTAHINHPIPDPGAHAAVPPPLARLIMRMMAKSRDDRPAGMADVMEELRGALRDDPTASLDRPRAVAPGLLTSRGAARPARGERPSSDVGSDLPMAMAMAMSRAAARPASGERPSSDGGSGTPARHHRRWGVVGAAIAVAVLAAGALAATRIKHTPPLAAARAPPPAVAAITAAPLPTPTVRAPDPVADVGAAGDLIVFGPGTLAAPGSDGVGAGVLARHAVEVGRFMLGRREVSFSEFRAFVEATRAGGPRPWDGIDDFGAVHDLPVNLVTNDEAARYCAWRYPRAGGRLPTEEEWEFAARDGRTERRFPWAGGFDSARVNGAGGRAAHLLAVDTMPEGATARGLRHMAGNVAEWTATMAPLYAAGTAGDPIVAAVVRGGSARSTPDQLAATARVLVPARMRDPWIGFRCAARAP